MRSFIVIIRMVKFLEIKFEIHENKIRNFSENAKNKIVDCTKGYTLDIIEESEKIELCTHEGNYPSEVTSSHVECAANKFRSIRAVKKQKTITKILKIISEVLLFASGVMFLPEQFVTGDGSFNIIYFIIFLIVLTVALITCIISYFQGGE